MYFYRGREGMWAWLLHRVAGVSILLFLIAHIADTSLVLFGPKWYNHAVQLYARPLFRVGEVGLAAAILFHSLNGIRITIIDFWSGGARVQRRMFYAVAAGFIVLFTPLAYVMLRPIFGGGR